MKNQDNAHLNINIHGGVLGHDKNKVDEIMVDELISLIEKYENLDKVSEYITSLSFDDVCNLDEINMHFLYQILTLISVPNRQFMLLKKAGSISVVGVKSPVDCAE